MGVNLSGSKFPEYLIPMPLESFLVGIKELLLGKMDLLSVLIEKWKVLYCGSFGLWMDEHLILIRDGE